MDRIQFAADYREARITFKVMTTNPSPWSKDQTRHTPGERKAAEDRWILRVHRQKNIAYLALAARICAPMYPTFAGSAAFAYIHGFRDSVAWYKKLAQDRKAA